MVNPTGEFWSDPDGAEDFMKEYGDRQGYYSSCDLLHYARHEYGHFLHHRQSPDVYRALLGAPTWGSGAERAIGLTVSLYAAQDPGEFVAEVFAGQLSGKAYAPAVKKLYRKYGGPVP